MRDYGCPGKFSDIMGRRNYYCAVMENCTCDDGFCSGGKCPDPTECPYIIAKEDAASSEIALMNYTYFLFATKHSQTFFPRKLIIYDEAHSIDKVLMGFVEIKIKSRGIQRFGDISRIPRFDKASEYIPWLIEISKCLKDEMKDNQVIYKQILSENSSHDGKLSVNDVIKSVRRKIENSEKRINKIEEYAKRFDVDKWVTKVYEGRTQDDDEVVFKPISVAPYSQECFFNYGEKHLYMSATLLDKSNFCRNIGIDEKDAHMIRVPSTFPPENRKIFFINTGSMSYKEKRDTLPKISADVNKIMNLYPDKKGMIYTVNWEIYDHIFSTISTKNRRRLLGHKNGDRNTALYEFIKMKSPRVLITPSLSEGIDLKDDRARFLIVVKMPYPNMSDPQVKAKKDVDQDWFRYQTVLTLIQVCGRGVRSPEDWCDIYILDSCFNQIRNPGWPGYRPPNFFTDDFIAGLNEGDKHINKIEGYNLHE